jgi:hypothetical protein
MAVAARSVFISILQFGIIPSTHRIFTIHHKPQGA